MLAEPCGPPVPFWQVRLKVLLWVRAPVVTVPLGPALVLKPVSLVMVQAVALVEVQCRVVVSPDFIIFGWA